MKIEKLAIWNYKSCKEVSINPAKLSIIIGRNAAGKSNFVDGLDFLGQVYRVGLENAVAIKGGYENIAFRRARRARSEIGFSVCARLYARNVRAAALGPRRTSATQRSGDITLKFSHEFAFRAHGREIGADFNVTREKLSVDYLDESGELIERIEMSRDAEGRVNFHGVEPDSELARSFSFFFELGRTEGNARSARVPQTELMISLPYYSGRLVSQFSRFFRNISVFQLTPDTSRQPGVPSPNPTLGRGGTNLPAVINWLKRRAPEAWKNVQAAMADIAPEIERIDVDYLHTRTLGLNFYETGVGRPWTVEQVSDGTIRALAMLVSCFDPRPSLLVIEEPENSVHPWVVQSIIKNLRNISHERDVIITSHSPSVINSVSPDEVWVAYKRRGATSIAHLPALDTSLLGDWKNGAFRLFDYIESGMLPQAIPGGEQ